MKAIRDIEVLIVEDDLRIAEIQRLFIEKIEGFKAIGIASSYVEAKASLKSCSRIYYCSICIFRI